MTTRTRYLAMLWALFFLVSCDGEAPVSMISEVRHPNGLVAPQPENLDVAQDDDGLRFSEPSANIRTPLFVDLTLTDEAPPKAARSTNLDGTVVRYLTEELDGGSGGATHVLHVWRPVGNGWILMRAEQQNEGTAPRFTIAWEMMKKARIEE